MREHDKRERWERTKMLRRFFNHKTAGEEPYRVMEEEVATRGKQGQEPDAAGKISTECSDARQFMLLLREDIAIADGDMDSSKAQHWLDEADDLLARAEDDLVSRS